MIKTISTEEIYKHIAVRSPYYALKNLQELGEGFLKADIPVEQPLGYEAYPISAGETARHLAILGNCASSVLREEEGLNYYLATNAIYKRHVNELDTHSLIATAKAENVDKRHSKAHTELLSRDNQLITSLDVEYTILSKEVFERQFKEYRLDMRTRDRGLTDKSQRQNLYRHLFFTPFFNNVVDNTVTLSMGIVEPNMCMGHFPLYPALPIAFSSTILFNLSAALLRNSILNKSKIKFYVNYTNMTAHRLIFIGTNVDIKITFQGVQDNMFIFTAKFIDSADQSDMICLDYGVQVL